MALKNSVVLKTFLIGWLCLAMSGFSAAAGAEITVVDIAGREVTLAQPAKKIILGEGRFLAALGVLGIEQPLSYVAGMMDEFRLFDPTSFALFKQAYPGIDNIPTFGHTSEDSVSVEKILLLNPDVAIFGLLGHGPGERSRHVIDRLEAANIPVVFVDFRADPIKHTAPSVALIATLLGEAERGKQFAEYYQNKIDDIKQRTDALEEHERKTILFELRTAQSQECCLTVANGMFADMARLTGGRSIAEGKLPGSVGTLSKEFVLSSDFDVYIGTAIGSPTSQSGPRFEYLLAGPGVDAATASQSLEFLLDSRGLLALPAMQNRQAYVLWHHFYNSPLNLYAIEKMATWLHPEHFADLQPEQTLNRLLSGFAPVDLTGVYATGLPKP